MYDIRQKLSLIHLFHSLYRPCEYLAYMKYVVLLFDMCANTLALCDATFNFKSHTFYNFSLTSCVLQWPTTE